MKQPSNFSVIVLTAIEGFTLGIMAKAFFYGFGIDLPTGWMGVIGMLVFILFMINLKEK